VRKDSAGIRIVAEEVKDMEQAILDSDVHFEIIIKNKNQLKIIRDKVNYTQGLKVKLMVELEGGEVVSFKQNDPMLVDLVELDAFEKEGIKVRISQ
jgi:hypothetical protein